MKSKTQKRLEAQARDAAAAKRTVAEKLARLRTIHERNRGYRGHPELCGRSSRERAKLDAQLRQERVA